MLQTRLKILCVFVDSTAAATVYGDLMIKTVTKWNVITYFPHILNAFECTYLDYLKKKMQII